MDGFQETGALVTSGDARIEAQHPQGDDRVGLAEEITKMMATRKKVRAED